MFKFLNKIANSYWYDFLGVLIVIGGCTAMGYLKEVAPLFSGSGIIIPIGIISIVSALFSLESDRFESRLSNIGNWIGIPSILLTMYVDMSFGNRAAIITYPVTMLIQIIATYVWHKKGKYNVTSLSKPVFALCLIGAVAFSLLFSYATDFIGFGAANAHGTIFWTTTLAFAVSIIANLAEMAKLQFNNKAWIVYNFIQLAKAIAQGNLANVFKIIYYLGNNVVSIVSWSDKGRAISRNNKTAINY